MDPPKLHYNIELYEHIKQASNQARNYMLSDMEPLGEGAAGVTFTAWVKPRDRFPDQVVVKEQGRHKYSNNEFEALKLLRHEMLHERIPGYFIFLYGTFNSSDNKYMILEKADYRVDDYTINYNINTKTYLQIFYHIAQAVSYLESIQFNHGDLWSENVMMSWAPNQLDKPIYERDFTIKIIDFDSAYKPNSEIIHPSYGGADNFRKNFYLGYDLNRYFDSLIYAYESYIEKKAEHKKKKIERAKKQRKRNKNVRVPKMDESDSSDHEFDRANAIYPDAIVDLLYAIGPQDPNVFKDCPDMSGAAIMKMIKETAGKLKVDLSTFDKNKLRNNDKMGTPSSSSDDDDE